MMLLDAQVTCGLLKGYSLEITAKDSPHLEDAAPVIPAGTAVSITFLPGENVEARVSAAATAKKLGMVPVPHISARRLHDEGELRHFLARLQADVGVERAFVVGGDPAAPHGPYPDALSIIESGILSESGVRRVGIGGYPEGHPDIPDALLWRALVDKSSALKAAGHEVEIVTQFGFDEEPILRWLEKVRDAGIDARVRVGLPGPANVKTLLRFAARCGVGASTTVLKKYGISITRLLSTAGPDRLLNVLCERIDPLKHGEVGFHLYPFGGLRQTAEWARAVAR